MYDCFAECVYAFSPQRVALLQKKNNPTATCSQYREKPTYLEICKAQWSIGLTRVP